MQLDSCSGDEVRATANENGVVRLGDSITLYRSDCLEVLKTLPDGCVDVLITDPVWPNALAGITPGTENPEALLAAALARTVARRLVIILRSDSDPRFLRAVPSGWPFFRVQILPYAVPGYIGRKLGGDELAYCFGEPLPSAPGRRVIPGYAPKVQPSGRPPNGHPCSRALGHMKWLVNWWSLDGETVLDPFMGSGTTGVACVQTGRNFIGIEISEEYFKIAQRRISEAQLQIHMPLDPKSESGGNSRTGGEGCQSLLPNL